LSLYENSIHDHLNDFTDSDVVSVSNVGLKSGSRKAEGDRHIDKDKSDRATTEQVLDPRTRLILLKMLNANIIYEINGCISTGKEV
jgi:serine/threonine-protein kinase RIO1